jgi:DNA-directed RNA polymerase specialized sigma subunit
MTDEIDRFSKKKANANLYGSYRGRRDQELEMWKKWKEGGQQQHDLAPLLQSLDPLITREAKKRAAGTGGRIPFAAIKAELVKSAVKSLQGYDPSKASLTSFVSTGFQRVSDFVEKHRNTVYAPRSVTRQYATFQNAKNEFIDEFGREPTEQELAQRMYGTPSSPRAAARQLKDISSMQRSFAPEVFGDVGGGLKHDTGVESDALRSSYLLMKSRMTEEQRRFGDLHFPPQGQRQPTIREIAKRLNITEQRAYQVKAQVEKLLAPTLRKV